jgi:hypothetical protein
VASGLPNGEFDPKQTKPRLTIARAVRYLYKGGLDQLNYAPMIRQVKLRRLSMLLIGLFVVAQICGVGHLLGEHTVHLMESQLAASIENGAGIASHNYHHVGDADGTIQHHELQDLTGAPAFLVVSCEFAPAAPVIAAHIAVALTGSVPDLLERPPKHSLSV